MTLVTGTYDISTLLAARFQSVAEFGVETVQQVLNADIAAHNQIVTEMMGDLCEISTDRQRIYGTSQDGEMVETDEFGRAPTQKSVTGATVGFPLRLFQFAVGWTEKWMQTATPADMATKVQAAEKAHLRAIQRELKKAIYGSTNYTFNDHLVDNVALAVKRFVNADSAAIPNGPNGETFDGATHTHYLDAGSLVYTDIEALVDTVVEHGFGGQVYLAINKADETAVRALTGFSAYLDARLALPGAVSTGVPLKRLDVSRLDNRAIGIFHGAEVWVKPWAIANFAFAWDAASPQKPLVFRQRTQSSLQGLRIAATLNAYPLVAQYMEAEYGIGVWTRTNGAVHEFDNASYTDPTIT